jgi:two-component system sensor histidine kinase VanS
VSVSSLGILYALYSFIEVAFNGNVIDTIENIFGYEAAINLKSNKLTIVIIIILFTLVMNWIIVELIAVRKLASVINKMDVIFKKDDNIISLDKQFKDIENKLNSLKLENIRNEQLAQVEVQRKNDLIAYLAHDIKTPLASVIGYLSLLDEVPEMPLQQKSKYTKIILSKAYRLEQLINEFFEITRFNLASIPLEKEDINLQLMLTQMSDEFYPMLAPGGRSITLDVKEDIIIYSDPDKLARVFNNILKNAIAYSYENSNINVKVFKQDKMVIINFENKGKVIPPEKLKMIFEKFYRLDSARSTDTGGAGLGLAIAKEIVLAHNGTIVVESNEEATIFSIEIPMKS